MWFKNFIFAHFNFNLYHKWYHAYDEKRKWYFRSNFVHKINENLRQAN
jgi:hypothetical protein